MIVDCSMAGLLDYAFLRCEKDCWLNSTRCRPRIARMGE